MPDGPPRTFMVANYTVFTQQIGTEGKHPRIALVTGLETEEFNGTFVLARLADYLRGVVEGAYPGQRLRSRVMITLASRDNPARVSPWPAGEAPKQATRASGRPWQPNAAQSVEEIIESTRPAYYRVKLGASSTQIEELPQVCLHECSDDERASAFLFGLPAIIENPMQTLAADKLATAWRSLGGENFVIHAGQAGNLQPQHCEKLFRALVSFLDRTGVLEGIDLSEEEDDIHHFGVHQTLPMVTDARGFFVSRMEVGRWVRAGESVGMVYDKLLGVLTSEVRAPTNGLVSALRRYPPVVEGTLVARIQTHESFAAPERAEGDDHEAQP